MKADTIAFALFALAAKIVTVLAYDNEVWDHNKHCVQFLSATADDDRKLNAPEGFAPLNEELHSTGDNFEEVICKASDGTQRFGTTLKDGSSMFCNFGTSISSSFSIVLASAECEM